jgi:hypothetical protein
MNETHLVQILLPTTEHSKSDSLLNELVQELTVRFGGATSFLQSPAEGRWKTGTRTAFDEITIVEVMTPTVDPEFWTALRFRLENRLDQQRVIIRMGTVHVF